MATIKTQPYVLPIKLNNVKLNLFSKNTFPFQDMVTFLHWTAVSSMTSPSTLSQGMNVCIENT